MTASTLLLPGVDQHGAGLRVRIRFGAYRHTETGFTTPDQANRRALELKEMRRRGQVPDISPEDLPLAKIGRGLLAEKATDVSSKTGRKLRSGTLAWWKRIVEPWNEEFGDVLVSMLRRAKVKEVLTVLASSAVPEANNRLVGIKAMLRYAESLGCTIDHSILTLKEFPHTPRVRVALSAFELEFLVLRAPEHGRRMLLFKGTVGNRWSELATWVDARFDAEAQTMFMPAGLCKEATDKTIDFTAEEVQLVREQLVARAPGSRCIFPTATGLTWKGRYGDWHRDVWTKAVVRSARDWRELNALDDSAPTPYEWPMRDEADEPLLDEEGQPVFDRLEPHDLRATAITLMRDSQYTKEQTAARVGHTDTVLIDRIYDRGDPRARAGVRTAIDTLTPKGIRAALAGETPQPSASPVTALPARRTR